MGLYEGMIGDKGKDCREDNEEPFFFFAIRNLDLR